MLNQDIQPKVKLSFPSKPRTIISLVWLRGVSLIGVLVRGPISPFIVHESSMEPSYNPGDHVLTFNWYEPRKNDVIIFRTGDKYYLKRVDRVSEGLFYVSGDNKRKTTGIGPVKRAQIVGKIILKY